MNPTAFSELLADISDEYIVSAANPHSKPTHWYQISAVAACIVLLISAAIYPKLRSQTPEITEPPAAIVATETTAQNSANTTAGTMYTTVVNQKVTRQTTTIINSQIVTETVTAASTTHNSPPIQTVPVKQYGTEPNSGTVLQSETKPNAGTTNQTITDQPVVTISIQKSRTTDIPPRPSDTSDSSDNPRGDEPGGDNSGGDNSGLPPASTDAEIQDYYDYFEITFYDMTLDAVLTSGHFDSETLTLQFMLLEYDPWFSSEPFPVDTVQFRLDLPDALKGKVNTVELLVSATTERAVFSDYQQISSLEINA